MQVSGHADLQTAVNFPSSLPSMFDFLSEEALEHFFDNQNIIVLFACIAGLLLALGKAADKLVGEAVILSERSGLPKVVIGATIVSLGTTSPEAAVSVLAALQGDPGLALGNAVGSIIAAAQVHHNLLRTGSESDLGRSRSAEHASKAGPVTSVGGGS